MKIFIIAVGRWRRGPERDLFDAFAGRLAEPVSLIEVEERRRLPVAQRVRREAELLVARIPDGAFVIALDERGKALSSDALAARLGRLRDTGRREVAFVVGGADGLARTLIDRADLALSLGPMTWPHMLVRVMLVEQIYRAETILAGHPYHRAGPPPA